MLPPAVMDEIQRYLYEYCWEWRTICKVINFKFGYLFEIDEIEKMFRGNQKPLFCKTDNKRVITAKNA